ncbi:nickel-responsive transcriptional regulator NikR [candidate division WOR-3 bacterium]|uniref:Putative nickel-responsive regulator n=1 Tax=candidate division WOR-3 bacterium TaxID=2052148 RepID=A0A660SMJ4_UNCW3|nr:MAG: nickel-responsive transcriptional regulator NikR [candidate division WOR-3 bacterium]
MEEELLTAFDQLLEKKGYNNRSEAIRDLIRRWLVEDRWEKGKGKVGILVIVYDHRKRELSTRILKQSHHHHHLIVSTLHIHLDKNNCLEVNVLRGRPSELRRLSEALIATRGVKYGRLVPAPSGEEP